MKVFGKVLVAPGAAADSNIVKAIRGLSPFGIDIDPPPPGAVFDRMPAERPGIPELSIQFIEKWINDGCPDDDVLELEFVPGLEAALGPDQFVVFFREFDQFFAFEASDDTRAAIDNFFPVANPLGPASSGRPTYPHGPKQSPRPTSKTRRSSCRTISCG